MVRQKDTAVQMAILNTLVLAAILTLPLFVTSELTAHTSPSSTAADVSILPQSEDFALPDIGLLFEGGDWNRRPWCIIEPYRPLGPIQLEFGPYRSWDGLDVGIAELPEWQQKLLSDPGWNQPHIPPREDAPSRAPTPQELRDAAGRGPSDPVELTPRAEEHREKHADWVDDR